MIGLKTTQLPAPRQFSPETFGRKNLAPGVFIGIHFLVGVSRRLCPCAPQQTRDANRKTGTTPDGAAEETSDLAVFLFFSGGGKRASALSYGVLKELSNTTVLLDGKPQRLLDHVELISSVSGGSFTAAYYCLYKDRIFGDYEKRYLKRNTNRALGIRVANPVWWPALWSRYYARSDMAARYYDKKIFNGATFDDLSRAGNKPRLFINATDVAHGEQFVFSDASFSLIGSDFGKFPIARAVAASSAVPVIFTPITLKNHSDPERSTDMLSRLPALQDDPHSPFAARRRDLRSIIESFIRKSVRISISSMAAYRTTSGFTVWQTPVSCPAACASFWRK